MILASRGGNPATRGSFRKKQIERADFCHFLMPQKLSCLRSDRLLNHGGVRFSASD